MSIHSIYRKIAKEHGVSVAEVKNDIQSAINAAWNNPNKTAEQMAMQKKFASGSTTPPKADDFIKACSSELQTNK